jgi:hypothetical protein
MRIFLNQAQWQTLIEDQQSSDLTIPGYCHLHQLSKSSFYAARNKMANIPSAFVRTKVTQGVEVSTTLQAIELLLESAKIILPSTISALILVNCFESSLNEDVY